MPREKKAKVKDLVDLIDQHLISTTQHTSFPAIPGRNTQSTMFVDWDGFGTPRVSYRKQDTDARVGKGAGEVDGEGSGDVRKVGYGGRGEEGNMRVDYDWECPPPPERKKARTSVRQDRTSRVSRGERVSTTTMGTAKARSRDSGFLGDSPPSYTRIPRSRKHSTVDTEELRMRTRTEMPARKFVRQNSLSQARSDVPEASVHRPAPPRYRNHTQHQQRPHHQPHLPKNLQQQPLPGPDMLVPPPTNHKLSGFDPDTHLQYSYNGSIMHIHRSPDSTYSLHSEYYEIPASEYVDCGGQVRVADEEKEEGEKRKGKNRTSVVGFIIKMFRVWNSAGILGRFSGKGETGMDIDTETRHGGEGQKERQKDARGSHQAPAQPPKHYRISAHTLASTSRASALASKASGIPQIAKTTRKLKDKPLPPLPALKHRTAHPIPK